MVSSKVKLKYFIRVQVEVRPFFRPQHFWKKITWLELALNSEQNYVFFFSIQFDLDVGYRPC
jgi:hypothetical protein